MSAHAKLSPSALDRILSCPASVNLTAEMADSSSSFAQEGTKAHEDLETCLMLGVNSDNVYLREVIDYVNMRMAQGMVNVLPESRVHMDFWLRTKDCWGTADIILTNEDGTELEIVDLKYGQGILVEPEDNSQLQAYAMGAISKMTMEGHKIMAEKIVTTIAQPRIADPRGTIRSTDYSLCQLHDIAEKMRERIALIDEPKPVYGPSKKACRWCKAKAQCKARANDALNQLGVSFDPIEVEKLKRATLLTEDERIQILDNMDAISAWMKDVADSAFEDLKARKEVQGYKLVHGRANRKWVCSTEDTMKELKSMGFLAKEYLTTKLASPAAIEKVVKARKMKVTKRDKVSKLIEKPPGKLTMVHETDSRPSAIIADTSELFSDVSEPEDAAALAALLN